MTLKVITDGGRIYSDDRHPSGGIDIKQTIAFRHITGDMTNDTCVYQYQMEILEMLCDLHGWTLEVTNLEDSKDET